MNEMTYASSLDVQLHGGLGRCDMEDLNQRLRRDIHSRTGYNRPIDLASRLARRNPSTRVRLRVLPT